MDFYNAYFFLKCHPKGKFMDALDIELAKVNPVTKEIDADRTKNSLVQVWLETGPEVGTHDFALDCGGNTFEEAIIKLAGRVQFYYDDNCRDDFDDLITCIYRL